MQSFSNTQLCLFDTIVIILHVSFHVIPQYSHSWNELSILSLIGVLVYADVLYDLMYTLYDLLCILGYCKTQILLLLLIIQ